MSTAFVAVSAVVPSLLLLWYFHSRDAYPEPGRAIWLTFGLGVLSTIPTVLVVLPVTALLRDLTHPFYTGASRAFLAAAMPEEFFKFIVVSYYCARQHHFDEPVDGLVYGVAASLGFATLENVLYVAQGGLSVALLRGVTAVPAHATLGAIMGYYVGQAHANPASRTGFLLKAWAAPTLCHGLYDFPLLALQSAKQIGFAVDDDVTTLFSLLTLTVLALQWHWAIVLLEQLREVQNRAPRVTAAIVAQTATVQGIEWYAACCFVLLGVILASVGGILTLGVLFAIVVGTTDLREIGKMAVGLAIIGPIPFAIGSTLFLRGVRRLNG